jgi:hypothetical protein
MENSQNSGWVHIPKLHVELYLPKFDLRLMHPMHRVETKVEMILLAVTTIFRISMIDNLYYGG